MKFRSAASSAYESFLQHKVPMAPSCGMEPPSLSKCLKLFQNDVVRWALKRGRAALFENTGLGKTLQQLVWADVVAKHTKHSVIIFTPLAVAQQTIQEAKKFGIKGVEYAPSADKISSRIVVTNYDRIENFDLSAFAGVVLDESSILKHADGKTRTYLINSCRDIPWRLACTATPAPNDYKELGNHSEFLGVMDEKEMLAMFFVHDGGIRADGVETDWRLKKHAEADFWRWLSSWSVVIRSPMDLGYEESGYNLPPLVRHSVVVKSKQIAPPGYFFAPDVLSLGDRIKGRASSVEERVRAAAEIVARDPNKPWLLWCGRNDEAALLLNLIPGAEEVRGSDSRVDKERRLLGFVTGSPRILITKPSIAGFGMNWQHCSDMIFVGLNDSFEQMYQAIRRCWRFGQEKPVNVYVVSSDYEGAVVRNVAEKEKRFERMYEGVASHMLELTRNSVQGGRVATSGYNPQIELELPQWL